MSIIWIAAYPKSGSTWLRTMLTNYLHPNDKPASINNLLGGPGGSSRSMFDEMLGLDSSDMTEEEVLRCRPLFQDLLAAQLPHPTFYKTHEAYLRGPGGVPVHSRTAAAGAIYLVRNPLDLAVSYAHHLNQPIDRAMELMDDTENHEWGGKNRITRILPQRMLTWSGHVSSWLEQEDIPLHVTRYEGMLANPVDTLGEIIRFAGLQVDAARLRQAVEHATFERLREQEAKSGYREKQPTARSFFRAGVAGGWRDMLGMQQVRRLLDAHGTVMEHLGYRREAGAFLSNGATRG